MNTISLNVAAHIVQLALTPIFLLTGIAALLNVFTARLGRVADRVNQLAVSPTAHRNQYERLRMRSRALDLAVILAAFAGGLTCCAALSLFMGALGVASTGRILFAFFGAALICAVLALAAFSFEASLAGRTVRDQARPDECEARAPSVRGTRGA